MLAPTTAGDELAYQNLLGSPLNILQQPNIFVLKTILECRKSKPIITRSKNTKEVSVPGIEGKLIVSDNIEIVSTGNETTSSGIQVESGSELVNSLAVGTHVNATFLGMKVDIGGGYSYESTVKKNSMYAMMAIDQTQFYTEMTTGQKTGDLSPEFLAAVEDLPPWGETDKAKDAYRTFFEDWGTHVIKRCHYGCRFTLEVQTENAALTDKTEYTANVTAEFGANFGTSTDGKKGDSYEEYQKQRRTTASVIGGDHESSLKLQREPDSKDRYAEWAQSNNKATNSAVTELTVHTLPKLIHDCGMAKWEDMDHALKHFTQSVSPQDIAVYGYLYTSEFKTGNYIDIQMWGAVSDFNMGSIDGGETKGPKHLVKSMFANNAGIAPEDKIHRYTGHVKIYGKTGQEFSVGIYHEYSSKNIHLCLFPPTGPINIDFDRDSTWNSITIPDLLASGNYRSSA